MKKLFVLMTILVGAFGASAQLLNPVKWHFSAQKLADRKYALHMKAEIDPGWHLYAQEAGDGPVPTRFTYSHNPLVVPEGKVKEVGRLIKSYDKNFKSELKYFANSVDFVQIVTLKAGTATQLRGVVEYMVCDDHQCLPPKELPFAITVGGK